MMPETEQDKATQHLEFLGFEIKSGAGILAARHQSKPSFYLTFHNEGMVFNAMYSTSDAAKEDPYRLLRYINAINEKTMVMRLFVNGDQDVYLVAFHSGAYEKLAFAHFLEYWENDIRKMADSSESNLMLQ